MATGTHEQTINTAIAEAGEGVGREWSIRAENVGGVFEGGGRPDVLIEKGDGWPIMIEAEVGNHHQAEVEATSRLNRKIASTGREVHGREWPCMKTDSGTVVARGDLWDDHCAAQSI